MAMLLADVTPAGASGEGLVKLGIWGAVLLGLLLALVWFVHYYRSRYRMEKSGAEPAFTLEDLREMRRRGDLTDREFQRLRVGILGEFADSRDGRVELHRANSRRGK